jgi:hypothetical protein
MRLPEPDDTTALAAYVDASAALLGLRLDPDLRPGVIEHLAFLGRAMALVDAFPLPEEVQPGPVFEP